jgi:hypothetical protein
MMLVGSSRTPGNSEPEEWWNCSSTHSTSQRLWQTSIKWSNLNSGRWLSAPSYQKQLKARHQNLFGKSICTHHWTILASPMQPNRNLSTSGLDSGSSWLDGVNGILMQQEPDSPKQDYWNRRAIASLANTLITVVEPVPMPLLYCLLCCCYSSRNACMKHCCYTNTCLNSYHYYQL